MGGDKSALIELGNVGAPFGVRGWVKLRSYTDPPERLLEHRSLLCASAAWRPTGRGERPQRRPTHGQVGRCRGSRAGGGVEGRRGRRTAQRAAAVASAKDYYRADLIGCEVVNLTGARLGVVEHFVEIPAHAIMVVRGEQEYWVPAVPQHLRRVEFEARRVLVDWDEAARRRRAESHAYRGGDIVSADAARGDGARRHRACHRAGRGRGRVFRSAGPSRLMCTGRWTIGRMAGARGWCSRSSRCAMRWRLRARQLPAGTRSRCISAPMARGLSRAGARSARLARPGSGGGALRGRR